MTRWSALKRGGRRHAGAVKRWLWPRPEVAAWQHACRLAEATSRYQKGTIRLADYQIDYVDLLSTCPQWKNLFVDESLVFRSSRDAPRILDCGANIGLSVLYFKRLYPRARITAYEADPDVFAALETNLRRNAEGDVKAVQAAVWTHNGKLSFRCEGADSGAVDAVAAGVSGDTRDVPAVRLKDLLALEPVDLLKLDIEGAERSVLEDCREQLGNVSALLLDLHEFDPARRQSPAILSLLDEAGFVYDVDELTPLPWREPYADEATPFPGKHLCWAMLVRAWRS